jgi:hypothetical protein
VLPSMTPAVGRAVEAARRFVGDAAFVEPTHLLHGLLDEEFGGAAALAARAGLDYARYLAGRGEPGPAREVPLSAASESLLFGARELSFELAGEGVVSSEALLSTTGGSKRSWRRLGRRRCRWRSRSTSPT